MNIFAIFLEFSFTRWVGTKRNDNFYFLYFSAFSNLFWLEMKPQWYYLIFFVFLLFFFWNFLLLVVFERNVKAIIFFAIFLEFSLTRQVGTKRNNNFYFLSLSLFQPILAWNYAVMVFFIFLNFYATFFVFSITHRVGTEQNDNFYFLSLVDLFHLILAWNEATMVFFLLFSLFLEFYISRRVGTERKYNFYFRSFTSFSNLFWLEKKP